MKPTPASSSPAYIYRNRYSYCFRIRIPNDLQPLIHKSELRYSLKTGYLGEAKSKARLLAGLLQKLFSVLREHEGKMSIDSKYIDDIIEVFKLTALDNYVSLKLSTADSPAEIVSTFGDFLSRIAEVRIGQKAGHAAWVNDRLDDILTGMGYDLEPEFSKDSVVYTDLSRRLMRETIERLQQEKERLQAEYPEYEFDRLFGQQLNAIRASNEHLERSPHPEPSKAESVGPLISEVIPLFVSEAKVNWTPKVKEEVQASLELFIECVGDVPIRAIKRAKVAEYKNILIKLPPNKKKSPQYRDKTIAELMEMDVKKTLSVERVNKHLQRAGAVFDYAIRHGIYEGANPATHMQVPKDRWVTEKRAPYTDEEIERLLRSQQYLTDSFKKAYMFWTPILALFHGMRLNEISGLHLEDVKQSDDGVWYFDLFSRKSNPRAARRVAPIHPFLIDELNFIGHVEKMRRKGFDRVFPELTKSRDGYGKNASRWFNDTYKVKCGIKSPDGRKRDFHSFRTTFITRLRYKKVHDRMLKEVVGHSVHMDVTDRYTDPYPLKQLVDEVMSKVEFHKEFDLSHLKQSKWVPK